MKIQLLSVEGGEIECSHVTVIVAYRPISVDTRSIDKSLNYLQIKCLSGRIDRSQLKILKPSRGAR